MSVDLDTQLRDAFDPGTLPTSPDPTWRRGRRQRRTRTAVTGVASLGLIAVGVAAMASLAAPGSSPEVVGPTTTATQPPETTTSAPEAANDLGPALGDRYADEERGAIAVTTQAPITTGVIAVTRIDVGQGGQGRILLASSGELEREPSSYGAGPAPSAGEHVLRHELRRCPTAGCSTAEFDEILELDLLSEPCEQTITTRAGEVTPVSIRWNADIPARCETLTFSAPPTGESVRVLPDVIGLEKEIAVRRLSLLGLEVDEVAVPALGRPVGTVVSQSIDAGFPLPPSSTGMAEMSEGQPQVDVQDGGDVEEANGPSIDLRPNIIVEYVDDTAIYRDPVSDVRGLSADAARVQLAEDGYLVEYVYAYVGAAALAEEGEVIDQDVDAGVVREAGSVVTVTVVRR